MYLLPDWFLCSLNIFRSSAQSKSPCYQCQLGLSQGLVQVWMTFILASCGKWLNCAPLPAWRLLYLHSSRSRIHRHGGMAPHEKKENGSEGELLNWKWIWVKEHLLKTQSNVIDLPVNLKNSGREAVFSWEKKSRNKCFGWRRELSLEYQPVPKNLKRDQWLFIREGRVWGFLDNLGVVRWREESRGRLYAWREARSCGFGFPLSQTRTRVRTRAHTRTHTRCSFQVRSSISLIHKCLARELVAIFVKTEENDWGRHDATESLFSRMQEPQA